MSLIREAELSAEVERLRRELALALNALALWDKRWAETYSALWHWADDGEIYVYKPELIKRIVEEFENDD